MKRTAFVSLTVTTLVYTLLSLATAQTAPPSSGTKNAINGINSYPGPEFVKYAADREPHDQRIDMFIGDWQSSMPRFEHGGLVLRDILTKGDNFAPPQKGAVLSYMNFLAMASLEAGASTMPSALAKQQEVYYILSGRGEITAGEEGAELRPGIAVFVPAGLDFVMKASDDQPLTMYVLKDTVAHTFSPREKK